MISKPGQWNYSHFFLRFQTEERVLRVNKSEITGENHFNGGLFDIKDNHESRKEENTWF